ncbi:hypothetical protein TUM17576_54960 [Enterobacter hormaechei]|nr:hypothetical protein [Enterobacter hormaechei]GJL38676.1 hypothetical protein TUM17576_54960 [Enterobacter hormaechei]
MNRTDADRYEEESVMRAGGIRIGQTPDYSLTEMLTAVLRNAPLAPSDNQGTLRNEPETPVA